MNSNGSTKWIISLAFTIAIAVAGWIFGGVNMKSAADHKLLIAQDELLYQREEQNTKLNAIQQDRIDKLEQKMDVFSVKLDQILLLLRNN
jgi:hypothetical protein